MLGVRLKFDISRDFTGSRGFGNLAQRTAGRQKTGCLLPPGLNLSPLNYRRPRGLKRRLGVFNRVNLESDREA